MTLHVVPPDEYDKMPQPWDYIALYGKRVLIIEHDVALVSALTAALQDAGCEILGFSALGHPMQLPETYLDAAVVDVDLKTAALSRLCDQLTSRGIPMLLITADDAAVPQPLRSTRKLAKPFTEGELLDRIAKVITFDK